MALFAGFDIFSLEIEIMKDLALELGHSEK